MNKHWGGVVRWLDQVKQESDTRGDAQLLGAFLQHDDSEAFARLVRRHGPMVQGVCRRVLGNCHDVEDAFQATFLVLLRKAASLQWRDRLGPWLHGVAYRTALKARTRRTRSRAVERPTDPMTPEPTTHEAPRLDGVEYLDEELLALPERYRLPLVLCEFQGLSRREAARSLKLPEGTLSSRLARGRQLLRSQLTRRGVTLSAAGLLTLLAAEARADLSLRLVGATVRTAVAVHAGQTSSVASSILTLTEGVVKSMFLVKLKTVSAIVILMLVLGGLATGSALVWGQDKPALTPAAPPAVVTPVPALPAAPATAQQFILRVRVHQQDKQGNAKLLVEPHLVTLAGRPASFLADMGSGGTKIPRHVPYGFQLTVTPTFLDLDRARLEISASLDHLDEEEGSDYRVTGTHVHCRKAVRLGQDEKIVLRKHADGSAEYWIELQVAVAQNAPPPAPALGPFPVAPPFAYPRTPLPGRQCRSPPLRRLRPRRHQEFPMFRSM